MVANDNIPTQAWLEFIADKHFFSKCLMLDRRLTWKIKNPFPINENRERTTANFIWFLRFEITFKEKETELRRKTIKVIT